MVGKSMIGITESTDSSRIDAATLPPFRNENQCARCNRLWGVWLFYCPGCQKIAGNHYHRECPCGAKWDER